MYNLLIALGLGALMFAVGAGVAGFVAGFIPGMIAAVIGYFVLARRTGRQVEAIMLAAGKEFEAGRVDKGRKVLASAMALNRWQFLVGAQVHAQLGSVAYMQRDFKVARVHLDKAWSRHWQAKAMLAAIEHREGKTKEALALVADLSGPGAKDPLYWGLYAWLNTKLKDTDAALEVLARGLDKCPDSDALKGLQRQIANKKKIKMKAFGMPWYQFFPEDMPRSMMMQMAANQQPKRAGGYSFPQPRR